MSEFSFLHWMIGLLFFYGLYRIITASTRGRAERYCKTCGTVATSKTSIKGSIFIEIVLWLCLIIPGLIYSLWRGTTRHQTCPACGSADLVPTNSPIAIAAKSRA